MYLSYEQMSKLTTKRLLAYKKKYLTDTHCNNYRDLCEGTDCTTCSDYAELQQLEQAYKNIRDILATREHVQ